MFWLTIHTAKAPVITQGIAAEKKEARAEKDEADRYKKLTQDLVSSL